MELTREHAIDAAVILNDFVGDISAGVTVLNNYRELLLNDQDKETALIAVQKMCLSHLILTLYKWTEFYDKYHNLFDGDLQSKCKELTKRIKKRDIVNFRHKCIGHIWDDDVNRPIYNSEISQYLNKIILNDIQNFLGWLHNPEGNTYPVSVVSVIEKCRNTLSQKYDIPYSEIMKK